MKHSLLLVFYVIASFVLVSNQMSSKVMATEDVELHSKGNSNGGGNTRSITILPVQASVNNSTVFITFWNSPSVATVTITHVQDGMVQTEVFQTPQTVQIPLVNGTGNYTIEICCENLDVEGDFIL